MSRRVARKLKKKRSQKKHGGLQKGEDSNTNGLTPNHSSTNTKGKTNNTKVVTPVKKRILNLQATKKLPGQTSPFLDSSPKVQNNQSEKGFPPSYEERMHELLHLAQEDASSGQQDNDGFSDSHEQMEKESSPSSSVASSVGSIITPISSSALESTVLYNNGEHRDRYSDEETFLNRHAPLKAKDSSLENNSNNVPSMNNENLDAVGTSSDYSTVASRSNSVSLEAGEVAMKNLNAKRRRRSSAVAPSPGNNLKSPPTLKHETSLSSIAAPKKKKRLLRPATISLTSKTQGKRMSVKDLRDLVLYILESKTNCPSWFHIENKSNITKIITLFVPGLEPQDLAHFSSQEKPLSFSDLTSGSEKNTELAPDFLDPSIKFSVASVQTPGSKNSIYSSYNSFLNVGLTKLKKQQLREEMNRKKITINDLLLNVGDLIAAAYPVHPETPNIPESLVQQIETRNANLPDSEEWVETKELHQEAPRTFALDCEMCLSANGHVLTRCSVVNFQNEVVYDQLVKPDVEIVDYLTKYSGITEEMLRPVTCTAKQVQQDLLQLISLDDVLIGHSLQSDLNILKLRHTKVVDTAFIYEHKAGPPFRPSLKYLSQEYLNVNIQNDDAKGHDSITDARTCMDLTKLKIQNGLAFGMGLNTESLFKKMYESTRIRSVTFTDYAPEFSYDGEANKDNCKSVKCVSDKEIFEKLGKNLSDHDFFVARLRDLEFERGYAQQRSSVPDGSNCTSQFASRESAIEGLKNGLSTLYEQIPTSALVIIFTATGDVTDYKRISQELNAITIKEERQKAQSLRQAELSEAVTKARDAMAMFITKT
ncbi:hypothetical protein ACO0RG_002296 [Hanseniaspora osmophila]|uniref:RNA exonuclease 1 n=1 Tax=Hanseniaspora osmophila TaxID=56408 RepID=A0A1E5RHN1_9ASCO|nr:RNA exonuclease 1 [Hanseniaspora osmophila]